MKRANAEVTVVLHAAEGEGFVGQALESVHRLVGATCIDLRIYASCTCSEPYRRRLERLARDRGAAFLAGRVGDANGLALEGLANIMTPWAAVLNDCDAYLPARLSVALSRLRATDAALSATGVAPVGEGGASLTPDERVGGLGGMLADLSSSSPTLSLSAVLGRPDMLHQGLLGPPWRSEAQRLAVLLARRADLVLVVPDQLIVTRQKPQAAADALSAARSLATVLAHCHGQVLSDLLAGLTRSPVNPQSDETEALLSAAQTLSQRDDVWSAAVCMEEAFLRAPVVAADALRAEAWALNAGVTLAAEVVAEDLLDRLHACQSRRHRLQSSWIWRHLRPAFASPAAAPGSNARFPPLPAGKAVKLADPEADRYLISGFSGRESWGRWTDGAVARIGLNHGQIDGPLELRLRLGMTFSSRFRLSVNGGTPSIHDTVPTKELTRRIAADQLNPDGDLDIRIDPLNPKLASQEPLEETRRLGVGVEAFRIVSPGGPFNR